MTLEATWPQRDAVDPAWAERAACKGMTNAMYGLTRPNSLGGTDWSQARAACASCPVATECLEHARANDEWDGMRGGLTPEERRPYDLTVRYRPPRQCVECGLDFTPPQSSGSLRAMCSDACRARRNRRLTRERYRASRPQPGPVPCVSCGAEFTPTHHRVVTCSGECYRERRREIERQTKQRQRVCA